MWIGAQISIDKEKSLDVLKKTIFNAKRHLDLNSLALWANGDLRLYEDFIEICKKFRIESYLWYPVLSDISDFKVMKEYLTLNFDGSRGYGRTGFWKGLERGNENFLFICPNNKTASSKLFELYKNTVDKFDFDGVFLDRIRFPSCVNGLEAIFSCFCQYCEQRFYETYDLSLKEYVKNISKFLRDFKQFTDKDIKKWQSFNDLWEVIGIKNFIDFKESSVSNLVNKFANYARMKSKKVGLDVYSFSISPIVCQNYQKLQDSCDWIKPMIYCHTVGPAGIPLELYSLGNIFKTINKVLSDKGVIGFFENALGIELVKDLEDMLAKGIDEEFLAIELDRIKKIYLSSKVKIYPGFEAVNIPGVCSIDETIIASYMEQVYNETEGFILSWNLLNIPESNLMFIGKFLRGQQ